MKEKDLRRRLGVLEATGLGIGAMIGGTIYAGTGIAMRISGGAADIAYLVAATIASLIAYSYAKLGGIVADSGGSYSIVSKIVGTRAGILVCTLQLAAYTIASAFYAVMAAEYASVALGLPEQEIALLMLATVVLLNVAGARESGLVEALISGLKLSILASIACYAAIVLRPSVTPPRGIVELFEASSMLFLGFEGFEVIASASGEMANPQRDVKVATAASLAAVGAVYTLLAYASRGLAEYGEYTILASLASSILGRVGVCGSGRRRALRVHGSKCKRVHGIPPPLRSGERRIGASLPGANVEGEESPASGSRSGHHGLRLSTYGSAKGAARPLQSLLPGDIRIGLLRRDQSWRGDRRQGVRSVHCLAIGIYPEELLALAPRGVDCALRARQRAAFWLGSS